MSTLRAACEPDGHAVDLSPQDFPYPLAAQAELGSGSSVVNTNDAGPRRAGTDLLGDTDPPLGRYLNASWSTSAKVTCFAYVPAST